jgi:hypothetical protein
MSANTIRALVSDQVDQLLAGSCPADDGMAQSGELAAQILGYQPVILGDCDAQRLHQVLPTCIGLPWAVAPGEITHR